VSEVGARPEWATWFQKLGAISAYRPFAQVGENAPRIVVSSPTGQFVAWMIAAGALGVDADLVQSDIIEEHTNYATWHSGKKRMADTQFTPARQKDYFSFVPPATSAISGAIHPVRRLPDGTPPDRGGAPPRQNLRDRLRHLPGLQHSWHTWWARHCISPVVIVGDGRDYLQGQRKELLEKAPDWFSDQTRSLLSEESGQTCTPERMYFHPFMVLSPESGDNRQWLRATRPRLVIVTSWTAYKRKHPSFFAGSPHVIITNRRVPSSLDAASTLQFDQNVSEWDQGVQPPPGVHVRVFSQGVTVDHGDSSDDDESEWEL
jgi:hypothetical protein